MAKQRAGMMTGDEKYLPARDKGPRRRFIRDTVDARWNIGEFMLPIMLIVLLLSFVRTSWALLAGLRARLRPDPRRHRRRPAHVAPHAPQDRGASSAAPEKGDAWYAIMRAFQMRRTRMPKPQVARGEHPA